MIWFWADVLKGNLDSTARPSGVLVLCPKLETRGACKRSSLPVKEDGARGRGLDERVGEVESPGGGGGLGERDGGIVDSRFYVSRQSLILTSGVFLSTLHYLAPYPP